LRNAFGLLGKLSTVELLIIERGDIGCSHILSTFGATQRRGTGHEQSKYNRCLGRTAMTIDPPPNDREEVDIDRIDPLFLESSAIDTRVVGSPF
jgi:hypothetical protein